MADNYLEKKMDDYRRRQSPTAHRTGPKPTDRLSIFIVSDNAGFTEQMVTKLQTKAANIAFTMSDMHRGRELAQSTGTQHHPIHCDHENLCRSIELIKKRWGSIDLAITDRNISDEKVIELLKENCRLVTNVI
ncbi:MAG: hypothetical protein NC111_07610 [Bacteroides sp.]|nr:hypothetical protein [Bacteroides sp.]MCM1414111.1 hypothetical protein [Bacteroides sp.]MCM1472375.1 hypothetical protein [Bacteroides sp.]